MRELNAGLRYAHVDYDLGQPVDPSGVTEDGEVFGGIGEYKRHLLDYSEQVARNVVSKLLVFSTSAEIEFADRSSREDSVS